MTKTQMRDTCQFNEMVGCNRYEWQHGDRCMRCGWNPLVFALRKAETRNRLRGVKSYKQIKDSNT